MKALLWTRENAARDAIELALSRMGVDFTRCDDLARVADACALLPRPTVLIFGPTFTRVEAESIAIRAGAEELTLVLLEDPSTPLATVVLEPLSVRRTLPLPVRLRALRDALEAALEPES